MLVDKIIDILNRAGCDRIEFAIDNECQSVKLALHRDSPPLSADYRISFVELKMATDPSNLESLAIDRLIAKFP